MIDQIADYIAEWEAEFLLQSITSATLNRGNLVIHFKDDNPDVIERAYRRLLIKIPFKSIKNHVFFLQSWYAEKNVIGIDWERQLICLSLNDFSNVIEDDKLSLSIYPDVHLVYGSDIALVVVDRERQAAWRKRIRIQWPE